MKKKYSEILKESLINFDGMQKSTSTVNDIINFKGGTLNTHKKANNVVSVLERMYMDEESEGRGRVAIKEGEETRVAVGAGPETKVHPDTKKKQVKDTAVATGVAHASPQDKNEFKDTIIDAKTDDKTLATESASEMEALPEDEMLFEETDMDSDALTENLEVEPKHEPQGDPKRVTKVGQGGAKLADDAKLGDAAVDGMEKGSHGVPTEVKLNPSTKVDESAEEQEEGMEEGYEEEGMEEEGGDVESAVEEVDNAVQNLKQVTTGGVAGAPAQADDLSRIPGEDDQEMPSEVPAGEEMPTEEGDGADDMGGEGEVGSGDEEIDMGGEEADVSGISSAIDKIEAGIADLKAVQGHEEGETEEVPEEEEMTNCEEAPEAEEPTEPAEGEEGETEEEPAEDEDEDEDEDELSKLPGEEDEDEEKELDVDKESAMRESIVSREDTEETIVERLIREMNLETEASVELESIDVDDIDEE